MVQSSSLLPSRLQSVPRPRSCRYVLKHLHCATASLMPYSYCWWYRAIQMSSANAVGVFRWLRTRAPRHVLCRAMSSSVELATTVHCAALPLGAVEWHVVEYCGTTVRQPNVRLDFALDDFKDNNLLCQDYACAATQHPTPIVQNLPSWRRLGRV